MRKTRPCPNERMKTEASSSAEDFAARQPCQNGRRTSRPIGHLRLRRGTTNIPAPYSNRLDRQDRPGPIASNAYNVPPPSWSTFVTVEHKATMRMSPFCPIRPQSFIPLPQRCFQPQPAHISSRVSHHTSKPQRHPSIPQLPSRPPPHRQIQRLPTADKSTKTLHSRLTRHPPKPSSDTGNPTCPPPRPSTYDSNDPWACPPRRPFPPWPGLRRGRR